MEIPGLQGDLEYIPFDPRNPTPALQRASEMISGLIAKAGGIKVETVVQAEAIEPKESEATVPPAAAENDHARAEAATEEDDFRTYAAALWRAIELRDWDLSEREYESGLNWVRAHEPDNEIFWKCLYQRWLFMKGSADAVKHLRDLVDQHKSDHRPLLYLAACLKDLREYEEAVGCYMVAASIAPTGRRASIEISAVDVLQEAKKPKEAEEILLRLRDADYAKEPNMQFRILQHLYSLSKESEDKFPSFALAELALHQRPEEMNFRFSLAFDYGDANQSHMSLYHYKIICDQDEKNSGALNNLGIALAESGLPVLAVQRYKESYKLGETLAASNLARRYLEAGLSEDATALLKDAQAKENCVPEVSSALAAIYEKIQENIRNQDKVVTGAEQNRNFLLTFAMGYLSPVAISPNGCWKFPSGEIELQVTGSELHGTREDRSSARSQLSYLFGEMTPRTVTRIEKQEFSGTLSGRTCKFKLEIKRREEPPGVASILGGPSDSKMEGYIVFTDDGNSAKVAELKAGKVEKYYEISRVTVHRSS